MTPSGFQPFDGIRRTWHESGLRFTFDDNTTLQTALEHIFIVNKKEVFAKNIVVGDNIGKHVTKIDSAPAQYFYDPLNVGDKRIYCHDKKFVSHNSFLGTGNTLISADALMGLTSQEPEFIREGTKVYSPPEKGHNYIMTVDVSKGRGIDYSAFQIIDVTEKPFRQVATFKDNLISPLLFPSIIYKYAREFNEAYIIVENNDQGAHVASILYYDFEYENMHLSSTLKADGIGVYMDKKVKHLGCSTLRDLVEQHKLLVVDKDTIKEMTTFAARGKSFEAEQGCHDDLVMCLVSFAWFTLTPMFNELYDDDMRLSLFREKMKAIEDDILPFGVVYDPADDFVEPEAYDTNFGVTGTSWDSNY